MYRILSSMERSCALSALICTISLFRVSSIFGSSSRTTSLPRRSAGRGEGEGERGSQESDNHRRALIGTTSLPSPGNTKLVNNIQNGPDSIRDKMDLENVTRVLIAFPQ